MLYFFIPVGDLISSILFMLYFSCLYLFGDVWPNYSIVSYTRILCRLMNGSEHYHEISNAAFATTQISG